MRDPDGIIQEKFAGAGDVGIGDVIITEGWPIAYSTPGGKDPQRLQFNQLYRWLFALGVEINQKGPYLDYDASIDYAVRVIVWGSDNKSYLALIANGPGTTIVDPVGDLTGTWIRYSTNETAHGYIEGFVISNGTDSDHDIDISEGVAGLKNGSNYALFSAASPPTKQIDANWAEGNNAGGFPSALTLSANTEYNFFLIGKDNVTIDAGFDTSLTAANLLADATGYTWYRRIGSVFTDGSSNIHGFLFEPDTNFFRFNSTITDVSDSTGLDAYQVGTITIPANKTGRFLLTSSVADEDNIPILRATDGNFTYNPMGVGQTGVTLTQFDIYSWFDFPVDGSSQLEYRISTPNPNSFIMRTAGWYDNRR